MAWLIGLAIGLAVVVCAFLAITLGVVVKGWVLSVTWQWFVVPIFGLPALSVLQAISIMIVASLLTHQSTQSSKNKDEQNTLGKIFEPFKQQFFSIFNSLIFLGAAAILHLLM